MFDLCLEYSEIILDFALLLLDLFLKVVDVFLLVFKQENQILREDVTLIVV